MPAFTTNVEFGYWLHTGKVFYGRPKDSRKNKYLDWLYEKDYNQKPIDNLEELLVNASNLANEKGVNTETKVLSLKKRKIME